MSRRDREARVSLDGLTGEQLSILRRQASGFLVAKASDLRLLHNEEDPERVIGEVAALGRLSSGLERGEVFVPDPTIRELVERQTTETSYLEEMKEEYERELAEHEAWSALLALLTKGSVPEEGGPASRRGRLRDRREFAAEVRRLMDAEGLTVTGLAGRACLDARTVEAILAVEHPIYPDEIYKLAGALGVTPGDLMEERPGREVDGDA